MKPLTAPELYSRVVLKLIDNNDRSSVVLRAHANQKACIRV